MTQQRFEAWNWQFDYGERPMPADAPLPKQYAIASYDDKGRLYRVVKRESDRVVRGEEVPAAFDVFVYDYFCDCDGRVLQKRSLDEQGDVFLIVDYEYNTEKGEVTESAWYPDTGPAKRSVTRPFPHPPSGSTAEKST